MLEANEIIKGRGVNKSNNYSFQQLSKVILCEHGEFKFKKIVNEGLTNTLSSAVHDKGDPWNFITLRSSVLNQKLYDATCSIILHQKVSFHSKFKKIFNFYWKIISFSYKISVMGNKKLFFNWFSYQMNKILPVFPSEIYVGDISIKNINLR